MSKYDAFISLDRQRQSRADESDRPPGGRVRGRLLAKRRSMIMVTGRLYDEATMLRVALAHERATKWHTMNPTLYA